MMELPILDIVTSDEQHALIVRSVLKKQPDIKNVEDFLERYDVVSKVAYRNVRQSDGSVQLLAAVTVTKVTPKAEAPPSDNGQKDG